MSKLTRSLVLATAVLLPALSTVVAPVASAEGGAVMPLSSQWRACDGTKVPYVDAVGDARATAWVSKTGSNVSATVNMDTAVPNTRYDIRLIQVPRPSSGCGPGAPGVIVGSLQTDAVGQGKTTFAGPMQSGATGAWVVVDRPGEFSQTAAEFYTSEYVLSI